MCHIVECIACGKTTWAGCGRHKDIIEARIGQHNLCHCDKSSSPYWRLIVPHGACAAYWVQGAPSRRFRKRVRATSEPYPTLPASAVVQRGAVTPTPKSRDPQTTPPSSTSRGNSHGRTLPPPSPARAIPSRTMRRVPHPPTLVLPAAASARKVEEDDGGHSHSSKCSVLSGSLLREQGGKPNVTPRAAETHRHHSHFKSSHAQHDAEHTPTRDAAAAADDTVPVGGAPSRSFMAKYFARPQAAASHGQHL